ncbi:hypothetical protein Q8791_01075 [Nocardiopsis sp. CT-R113]|uniref:Uncharacterized protein n=1 Tax=Nocardiopsis codii TaxID=3065942 RepID=A0ABU7K0P8_9ACTN|nr:hypothetical protein [Nocardiopsis sp. CT-R113]MEE2035813.1 hypothetical protein [Nocardiopsis sp. CT-R113]
MNTHHFGIVTGDGRTRRAVVELPGRPDAVVTGDDEAGLADAMSEVVADRLGVSPDDVDVTLFGHDGGDDAPYYAAAVLCDGAGWHTRFPAQEDLPAALHLPVALSEAAAEGQALRALASALGRPAESLDLEVVRIGPGSEDADDDWDDEDEDGWDGT